jgi:hypothetical protein
MGPLTENPFAVLSFIAAPALMTNASSVLVLSTSNRLARAIDQTRATFAKLEAEKDVAASHMHLKHLERLESRTQALRNALSAFYITLGAFASASLISVIGAGVAAFDAHFVLATFLVVALGVGVIGVSALVYGCLMLAHETRFALVNLSEETEATKDSVRRRLNPPPA